MRINFILFVLVCVLIGPDKTFDFQLKEVEIVSNRYDFQDDIYKADSLLAIAMLLNRECPTCSEDEKVHIASTIITGSRTLKIDWKTYLFDLGQFWGLSDPRIFYDPHNPICKSNLKAARLAWSNPVPVRFYASEIDTTLHFKQVSRNGFRKAGFHHYFSFYLN